VRESRGLVFVRVDPVTSCECFKNCIKFLSTVQVSSFYSSYATKIEQKYAT